MSIFAFPVLVENRPSPPLSGNAVVRIPHGSADTMLKSVAKEESI
jgi:hypothetical protein